MRKWRIEDSEELYNITGWGASYFGINEKGHVAVTPRKDGVAVDLKELMNELQLRDMSAPVLVRFPDILDNRIEKTANCFQIAAEEYGYKAQNFIIYPIKVNQMRPVVEEIISHGKKFNLGLEAGSKPELHAVIAMNTDSDSLIICNGYKDENYIELALLAQKMGKRIFLVVEKMNELRLIARLAKQLGVRPNLGIRIKLASSGSGKWEESGGDASKFGLTSSELLEALDYLEQKDMKECLKLIHFHIGSQITKIRRIKTALREASQFYAQLHAMGFNVEFVDIGGGLGVDYDGTRSSNSESSVNYSIQEYVNDSISTFVDVADKNNIPHPNIITESGRSLTAHHSVLIFEVLETASLPEMDENWEPGPNDHELVQELYEIWDNLNQSRMLEAWHDAQQIREEALDLFSHGIVDLKTRAQIERLYWSVTREINQMALSLKHAPEELRSLSKLLADKYFCNFSLFQSIRISIHRPAVSHHAHPAARRTARPLGHAPGHHVRLGREDCQLHIHAQHIQPPARAFPQGERTLLHRRLPRGRLPGNPGRPAQPLRRHERRAHQRRRQGIQHRPAHRRRNRRRGARLRAV